VIAAVSGRGKLPIVLGGSGLYVKALTHGLSALPSDESLRHQLADLTAVERVEWLLLRDPEAEQTVNLKNDRYVSRALEICILTGQPQSELRSEWTRREVQFRGVCLVWERESLVQRIHQRVHAMIEAGLAAEIAALGSLSTTAEKAIGIREMRAHLAGEITLDEAIAAIQQATRQYARRQDKWFKREKSFLRVEVKSGDTPEELAEKVIDAFPELAR
jgi:tRNA dimethylallyltransferase